ncbi:hypothetical protein AA0114_g3554 [Alternaria tenuissima]|uniref:Uncharacterized protein n=1 Tax=Alternaria tenuissima TaxID=119927 RepID=A0A4Q4MQA0_9PLEO|nr:hypothetical protein AA0114_g3554 [Alternaria tenuissima]
MASDAHLTYRLSSFGKKRDVLSVHRDSYMQVTKTGKKAINLPTDVKAYGDPTAFTADPDINLPAQINTHFSSSTQDLDTSLSLTKLTPESRNSIVCLQERIDPITLRTKDLLATNIMGEVLSSQDYVYDNPMQLDALPGSFTYSTDRKARGDLFDIHYVHVVDYVHEVPVKVQIQQPAMKILRADGQANKIVKSGSPVLLIVNGTLPTNKGVVVPEVKFMVSFRLNRSF